MSRERDPVHIVSDIVSRAQEGLITDEEAEAQAKAQGVGPLATKPAADALM